jgi:ATP-dependent Clp protease ATP-binding subunit ClpA
MGARPMARLIQSTIKTPLADDVLFGKLKGGGAVRVIVLKPEDAKESLGFEYPEGPVTPRPERDVTNAVKKRPRRKAPAFGKARKPNKPKGPGGSGGGIKTVPKVPLVRA